MKEEKNEDLIRDDVKDNSIVVYVRAKGKLYAFGQEFNPKNPMLAVAKVSEKLSSSVEAMQEEGKV